ncbi:hydrolase [Legionella taurinensis]|uniref:Hydrolase n=1 Tax=Legionella taurinensis TaxID=70611 RepID=A0A3A5L9D3_9GAMM|nr:hydrolase [Legionella taurinensis]MDX1836966.1 hydrolase [Legionella taurinensis]PUT41374.1 hydrolase [Legionella taurinensis]PUT42613.1 hydrolase [Legionella taurinensis]PUT46641.1 hydrolase [Legionella taurinensis]PUT47290.1 hydrolase [Legionella taurinensis]
MLLKKDDSCLLLIDVQEKLAPFVLESEKTIARCQWLMRLAKELDVPVLISEQYPSGLGSTVKPLQSGDKTLSKVHFSSWREPLFKDSLTTLARNQVVLIGIEAHVCVLQSAVDLLEAGFQVYVAVDAVSSRHDQDLKYGLKRMKQAGIELVTSEMIFFEWVGQAGTPEFKALSNAYLKQ